MNNKCHIFGLLAVFCSSFFVGGSTVRAADPPNILFLIADDMAADSLSALTDALGNGPNVNVNTPNLDALAARGMVFNNAYNMGGWRGGVCNTSRAAIMTGRSMWRAPGSGQPNSTVANSNTLPGVFNTAGYDTVRYGKGGNDYTAATNTFTTHEEKGSRDATATQWFADKAISYLDNRVATNDTDPFLMYLGFSHPHDSRNAPQSFLDAHNASAPDPDPSTPLDSLDPLPSAYLVQHPFDNGHLNGRDETRVAGVGTNRDERTIRNENGKNYAVIEYMDQQIGRVLTALEDSGEADNTIIVFTSDHGIAIGRHGLMGKQNLYEHTTRVPYLIAGPGIATGENDAMVYLHESMPTLLDLVGVAAPATVEGSGFGDVARGLSTEGHDAIYGAYTNQTFAAAEQHLQRSVRVDDWKLIHYPQINRTQLFNLADDPDETDDLAHDAQYAARVRQLATRLGELQGELDDPLEGQLGRIGVNVAFGKQVAQSSNFNGDTIAENAVDGAGSTLSDYTHTAADDTNPWWQVDLGGEFAIDEIVLHNREGCCQGRLRDITVEILDDELNVIFTSALLNPDNNLGGGMNDFTNGPAMLSLDLTGDVQTGQYVRVSRTGTVIPGPAVSDQYVLNLDEVQVFVDPQSVPEPSGATLAILFPTLLCWFVGSRRGWARFNTRVMR